MLSTEIVNSHPNLYQNFAVNHQAFLNSHKEADAFSSDYFKESVKGVKVQNLDNEEDDEFFHPEADQGESKEPTPHSQAIIQSLELKNQ